MTALYLNLYNNLIKLTTNKFLYKELKRQDIFSDRLILFLIHFAFFLKAYKNEKNTLILQEIYFKLDTELLQAKLMKKN